MLRDLISSKTMVRSATLRNRQAIQANRATIQRANLNYLKLVHETVDDSYDLFLGIRRSNAPRNVSILTTRWTIRFDIL